MDWNKTILLIGCVIYTLVLMSFESNGSFDPREIGFYTSIFAGIFNYFFLRWWFRGALSQKNQGKNQ